MSQGTTYRVKPWSIHTSLIVLAAFACSPAYIQRARNRCERLSGELASTESTNLNSAGVSFHPADLVLGKIHPHGGPQVCVVVGLAPTGWMGTSFAEGVRPPGNPDNVFRVSWHTIERQPKKWSSYIDQKEMVALETSSLQIERDEYANYTRVMVSRGEDRLHLIVIRGRPNAWHYLRCEAVLDRVHEQDLVLFESACMNARIREWEYPEW